jgi:hypothetical protein
MVDFWICVNKAADECMLLMSAGKEHKMRKLKSGLQLWVFVNLVLIFSAICYSQESPDKTTADGHWYLGQKPPELKPEIFLPRVLSQASSDFTVSLLFPLMVKKFVYLLYRRRLCL